MMMNKKSKLQKLVTPLIYVLVSGIFLFFIGGPILELAYGKIQLMVVKGAPSYPNEYDTQVFTLTGKNKDKSEVQIPMLNTLYAYIQNEKLNFNAPVYYGDSEELLLKGAGHYVGSGISGQGKQILIGGHDGTFFAPLEGVEIGDVFTLDTNYGTYSYEVYETRIASASDTSTYNLSSTEEELVLYTCYPFGQVLSQRDDRFFVYAKLIQDNKAMEVTP